jgi:hypothetical protein
VTDGEGSDRHCLERDTVRSHPGAATMVTADTGRAVAGLRELARRTSDDRGAQRLAWTSTWNDARSWLREQLAEIEQATVRVDPPGNLWATLPGASTRLPSGALHDASEMARVVPTVMLFVRSIGGVSHTAEENTEDADLELAVRALDELARQTIARFARQ